MTVDGVRIRAATYDDVARLAAVYRDAYAANVDAGFPSFAATVGAADVEGWLHDRDVFIAETIDDTDDTAGSDSDETIDDTDDTAGSDSDGNDGADANPDERANDDGVGTIVGTVQLRRRPERGVLELARLAVVEAAKERGIGGMLVEHAEQVARDRGHDSLRLRTFTGHPVLPDWYERLGYERVGREPMSSRPYDVLIMEKQL